MPKSVQLARPWIIPGVAALLLVLLLQLAFSVRRNSITWDEDDHIYAGYMSWKHADYGLNPEHPPLVKLIASLPLLNMQLKVPALEDRYFKHEAFLGGKDFLFKNDADTMLFRVRMAAASFTLLLALLVFLAARKCSVLWRDLLRLPCWCLIRICWRMGPWWERTQGSRAACSLLSTPSIVM